MRDRSNRNNPQEVERLFWEKVNKTDTCWLWTASTRSKGYGAFCYWRDGEYISTGRAHVYSWELVHGPVPAGMFVLHTCDTPPCVNPDHLFLGTNQDNVDDMMAKGRHVAGGTHCGSNGKWKRGPDHHAAKLTENDVREMRRMYATGQWSYEKVAEQFRMGLGPTYRAIKGITWAWVK